jgi:putative PEP-CTERM system TPR-repeat lipoprotein
MTSARTRLLGSVLLVFALVSCGALIPAHYRIASARKDMRKGDWRAAAVELRTVVQAHPKNTEAWLLLTRLSLDAGDPMDAPADLGHALAAGAKGPEVDELRVRTWLDTNHPQAALDALAHHTVTLAEPAQSLAIARADLALGQPAKTLDTLNSLLATHPDLKPAQLAQARVVMAEALGRTGHLGGAMRELDTAIQQDPKSPEPLLLKGRILASRGQYSAAESALTQALHVMSPAEPVQYRLAVLVTLTQARLAQGEMDAAAKSQALLAQLAPGAPVTRVLDARLKLATGHLSDGIDELEGVVADVPSYTEARMLLGVALMDKGDLEQAQEQLARVVQQAPDDVEARKLLATARLKLNEPEAALSVLTPALSSQAADPQMLALIGATAVRLGDSPSQVAALAGGKQGHPQNATMRLNLAQAYLTAGQAEKALAILEKTPEDANMRRDGLLVAALNSARGPAAAAAEVSKLLAAHPRDPRALSIAGAYFASQGAFDHAQSLLKQAIALDPQDAAAVMVLARVKLTAGDPGAARKTLQSALSQDPKALPIRLALAQVLAQQKAYGQAISLLKQVDPSQNGPPVQFALARVHLAQGDLKQADAALDRAIAMRRGQAPIVEDAGALLLGAHQYDAALARFAQATVLAPSNPVYWLNAARAQLALNQTQAARNSLRKASKLKPNWLPVVGTLALIDLHEHNGQAALARVNALLASEPHAPGAQALKGDVEAATGHLADALTAYAAAQQEQPSAAVAVKEFQVALALHRAQPQQALEMWLAKEPNDAGVREVLGNYYLSVHDLKPAEQAFEAVLKLSPNNVVALNNLAWVEDQLGEAGAQGLAERAHALAPQAGAVDDTLGWILARKHDTARALALLTRAAKQSPNDPDVQYHYAYVLAQDGKPAEAREVLTRVLAAHPQFDSASEARKLLASTRT